MVSFIQATSFAEFKVLPYLTRTEKLREFGTKRMNQKDCNYNHRLYSIKPLTAPS